MKTFNYSTILKKWISLQRTTVEWSFVFILVLFFLPSLLKGQTVTTAKVDNLPDKMVYASGAGWIPGETINIVVISDPSKAGNYSFTRRTVADRKGFFRSELFRPGFEPWQLLSCVGNRVNIRAYINNYIQCFSSKFLFQQCNEQRISAI
jgi:hypothetical protein